jgi:hypothetical protein
MTIFEASTRLYGWFSEHDSFCLDTDEKKLLQGEKRSKFERKEELAAIKCGLQDLEKLEMISCSTIEEQEVWVLRKGFDTLNQTITLSPETCSSIAHIVNGFCEAFDMMKDKADAMNVEEKDIKNLIYISAHLMDRSTEDKKDTEGE